MGISPNPPARPSRSEAIHWVLCLCFLGLILFWTTLLCLLAGWGWRKGHLQSGGLDAGRVVLQGLQQLLHLLLHSEVAPLLCQDVRHLLQSLQRASAPSPQHLPIQRSNATPTGHIHAYAHSNSNIIPLAILLLCETLSAQKLATAVGIKLHEIGVPLQTRQSSSHLDALGQGREAFQLGLQEAAPLDDELLQGPAGRSGQGPALLQRLQQCHNNLQRPEALMNITPGSDTCALHRNAWRGL